MDFKIELIFVPVSDTDRAKHFYGDQLGWNVDYDVTVSPELRFVQVTPHGHGAGGSGRARPRQLSGARSRRAARAAKGWRSASARGATPGGALRARGPR